MGIKFRLSLLTFLQFAVWGSYLVSLGQYLGSSGLGREIQWFYAVGGFAALFMPALMGAIADRYIQAQKLLGSCHFIAAGFMLAAWAYGASSHKVEFWPLFILFSLSVAFYIPTIALCNSVSFGTLKKKGLNPLKAFPSIRVWGTIGFVAMMWVVNSLWIAPDSFGFTLNDHHPNAMSRMQYTVAQLGASAIIGFMTAIYSFTLPEVASRRNTGRNDDNANTSENNLSGWHKWPVIGSFRLLGSKQLLPFFLFSMFLGVALQINNGYVTPYLTHFRGLEMYAGTFGAANATLLSSLSQISEALWILPVGCILARAGIKKTILAAMGAWVINFLCFALGNTGSGMWLIVTAMLVYGIGFDFFNIAGALFVDKQAPATDKSAAQGLFMMMTKGIGSSLGMIGAGAVVNTFCYWEEIGGHRYFMGSWTWVWLIFCAYCLLVFLAFLFFFKAPVTLPKKDSGKN